MRYSFSFGHPGKIPYRLKQCSSEVFTRDHRRCVFDFEDNFLFFSVINYRHFVNFLHGKNVAAI